MPNPASLTDLPAQMEAEAMKAVDAMTQCSMLLLSHGLGEEVYDAKVAQRFENYWHKALRRANANAVEYFLEGAL